MHAAAFRSAISGLMLAASAHFAAMPAHAAKTYSPEASSYALEQCLLSADAKTAETDTQTACCSKEAGICVVCPKTGALRCEITSNRRTLSTPLTLDPLAKSNRQMAPAN